MQNFRDVARIFREAEAAVEVAAEADFAPALRRLLADATARAAPSTTPSIWSYPSPGAES